MNEITGPSAKIILDSIYNGHRLVTMEVVLHRFLLAELNTHRWFSRNSASSRAIPIEKQIQRVKDNPALPIFWGKNKKGMQSAEELSREEKPTEFLLGNMRSPYDTANQVWEAARWEMISAVQDLNTIGLHKQLANRLIEPWMWHTVIISATEYDNFFHQRCHPDAQPEMKAVADAMQWAYYTSTPKEPDNPNWFWHCPYINEEDMDQIWSWVDNPLLNNEPFNKNAHQESDRGIFFVDACKMISVARCARVSYLTHDGKRDIQTDIDMFHNTLLGKGHWSPFEHVATPQKAMTWYRNGTGNFKGWVQYRKSFNEESGPRKFIPNLPELKTRAEKLQKDYLMEGF